MRFRPDSFARQRPRRFESAVPVHAKLRHNVAEAHHQQADEQTYDCRHIDRTRTQCFRNADAAHCGQKQVDHDLEPDIGIGKFVVVLAFRVKPRQKVKQNRKQRCHTRHDPQMPSGFVTHMADKIPLHGNFCGQPAVKRCRHYRRQQRQHPRRHLQSTDFFHSCHLLSRR